MDERKMKALRIMDDTLKGVGSFHGRKAIENALEYDNPEAAIAVVRQWIDRLECLRAYLSVNTF